MVFEGIPSVCNPEKSCDLVKTSPYAKTFGIFNAYYGVVIFFILAIITFAHSKKPKKETKYIIFLAAVIGSLIALRFLYLQAFIIHAYCFYCLVVDITMIFILLILIAIKDGY
jgi:uncharacterized membrane protein